METIQSSFAKSDYPQSREFEMLHLEAISVNGKIDLRMENKFFQYLSREVISPILKGTIPLICWKAGRSC